MSLERVEIEVDPDFESAFPDVRLALISVQMIDGPCHLSAATEAPGEPNDARWPDIVAAKFDRYATERPPVLDDLLRLSSADCRPS